MNQYVLEPEEKMRVVYLMLVNLALIVSSAWLFPLLCIAYFLLGVVLYYIFKDVRSPVKGLEQTSYRPVWAFVIFLFIYPSVLLARHYYKQRQGN